MTLQKIQEQLLKWTVIVLTIVASLFLVKMAGDGRAGIVAGALAGMFVAMLLFVLRERIWILVPLGWQLTGQIPSLGIPLTLRDIIVAIILGIFITLKAFKKITRKPAWNFGMTISMVLVLYVAMAWIRNPTGFAAIDSSRVGGRPYFNVLIGLSACWMLRQCSITPRYPTWFAVSVVWMRSLEGLLGLLIFLFPATYSIFSQYYDAPGFLWARSPEELEIPPGEEGTRRLGFLMTVGQPVALFVVSVFRPLFQMKWTHLVWPIVYIALYIGFFTFAIGCIFLSGFRSSVAWVGLCALVGTFLRTGWWGAVRMVLLAALSLFFLVLGQGTLYELPYTAHRALSWLPGKWDQDAIVDAASSTKWRTEMWEELLTTNRYIDNHTLGDGFGMKKRDYDIVEYNARWGDAKQKQENYMITGGVHSGPVSCIRSLGYVGLGILLTFLVTIAVRAFRIARRAKGTRFQTLAFFFCIPAIVEPFFFVLIFGSVENTIPEGLFTLGMLQMLENSLDDHEKANSDLESEGFISSSNSRSPYEPAGLRSRPAPSAELV